MTLSERQIKVLHKMLALTESQEVDCDQCQAKMAEFVERVLADGQVPVDLGSVERHLAMCGDCEQEFRALMDALEGER